MMPRQLTPLASSASPAPPQPAATPAASHEPLRLQRKAGACSCGGSCPRCTGNLDSEEGRIQRQLRIGASDDALEREADRVAAAVTASSGSDRVSPAAQAIQRLPAGGADAAGGAAPASVQQTLGRSGSALDSGVREQMEQRFGQDFDNVRVHADASAARSAEAIDAQAYTAGANIVFATGQYAPQSAAGQHLIAHELTHVVQQAGGAAQRVSRYRRKPRTKDEENEIPAWDPAEELTDSKTQPWIASITIEFTGTAADTGHAALATSNGELPPRMPTGTLTAKYSTKPSTAPADIVISIVGGSTLLSLGLTDRIKTPVPVTRLEGNGYTDSANKPADPLGTKGRTPRYSKSGAGTMNYAIFFKGIQAIHQGSATEGSHACVHVDNRAKVRTLNHHSWIGKTMVTVSYADSVLDDLCCLRKRNGSATWNRNPCGGTTCP
jgi:hypothetical protein